MQLRGKHWSILVLQSWMNIVGFLFESLLRREISFFDRDENAIGALTSRLSDDSRIVNKGAVPKFSVYFEPFYYSHWRGRGEAIASYLYTVYRPGHWF